MAGLRTEVAGEAAAAFQLLADGDAIPLAHAPIRDETKDRLLVAVGLGDGRDLVAGRGRGDVRDTVQQLGQGRHTTDEVMRPRVIRKQLRQVRSQHRGAGRLQHHDRFVAPELGCPERALQHASRHAQLPGGVPGEAATDRASGDDRLEPGGFQHSHGIVCHLWREVVVEGVGPEHDAAVWRLASRAVLVVPREGPWRDGRDAALGGDTGGQAEQAAAEP